MFDITGITPVEQLFHNVKIKVYPKTAKIEEISFWEDNFRTLLAFDLIKAKFKKPFKEIPQDEIIKFLDKQKQLKLKALAESIKRNGVRVPLIVLQDGTLLDGNRRYFACRRLLLKENERPSVIDNIPIWIILSSDATDRNKKKILAEANFVDSCKVPWTLDVKAEIIYEYYKNCEKKRMTHERIIKEIDDVYSVDPETIEAYINSIELTKEYIKTAPEGETNKYRRTVQEKFLYFWEFWNKTSVKSLALHVKNELPKLKDLFFTMMSNNRFSSYKQIEPMIKSIRETYLWEMLSNSKGVKIDQVEALYKEEKTIKSAEDKIRNFNRWIKNVADPSLFTRSSFKLLEELSESCINIIKKYT